MVLKNIDISDVRRDVVKGRNGNNSGSNSGKSNGNSRREPIKVRGRPNLRGLGGFTDEDLRDEVNRSKREVARELGGVLPDSGIVAARYLTLLRVSLIIDGEQPPSSVSHARRYGYDEQQYRFWRDRMIRALNKNDS